MPLARGPDKQAAARGPSPTQMIFPFCPAATVVALETRRCFTAGPHTSGDHDDNEDEGYSCAQR